MTLQRSSRPLHAVVNLAALRSNFRIVRQHAGTSKIWAVIKANAYGHGSFDVANTLAKDADGFALLDLEEAVELRQAGVTKPLLLLEGFFTKKSASLLKRFCLTPAIHSFWQIESLAESGNWPLEIYLKVNSGMNRLGFSPNDAIKAYALISEKCSAKVTLMTHFACADSDDGVEGPLKAFRQVADRLSLPTSAANSAALLQWPHTRGDWSWHTAVWKQRASSGLRQRIRLACSHEFSEPNYRCTAFEERRCDWIR
jgi:alanine racemase